MKDIISSFDKKESFTVEKLSASLIASGKNINQGSIYTSLDRLIKKGLVLQVGFGVHTTQKLSVKERALIDRFCTRKMAQNSVIGILEKEIMSSSSSDPIFIIFIRDKIGRKEFGGVWSPKGGEEQRLFARNINQSFGRLVKEGKLESIERGKYVMTSAWKECIEIIEQRGFYKEENLGNTKLASSDNPSEEPEDAQAYSELEQEAEERQGLEDVAAETETEKENGVQIFNDQIAEFFWKNVYDATDLKDRIISQSIRLDKMAKENGELSEEVAKSLKIIKSLQEKLEDRAEEIKKLNKDIRELKSKKRDFHIVSKKNFGS